MKKPNHFLVRKTSIFLCFDFFFTKIPSELLFILNLFWFFHKNAVRIIVHSKIAGETDTLKRTVLVQIEHEFGFVRDHVMAAHQINAVVFEVGGHRKPLAIIVSLHLIERKWHDAVSIAKLHIYHLRSVGHQIGEIQHKWKGTPSNLDY